MKPEAGSRKPEARSRETGLVLPDLAAQWGREAVDFFSKQTHQVAENIRWRPINGQNNPNLGTAREKKKHEARSRKPEAKKQRNGSRASRDLAAQWGREAVDFLSKQTHQVAENIRWSPINGQNNPNFWDGRI